MATLPLTPPPSASFGLNIGSYACGATAVDLSTSAHNNDCNGTSSPPMKPKQSKSRNGCVTCKAKRLKCDETKPTCKQCQKRGVPCGGYKKDFKWRPFEESSLVGKSSKSPRKGAVTKSKKSSPPPRSVPQLAFTDTMNETVTTTRTPINLQPITAPNPSDFLSADGEVYIIRDASSFVYTPPNTASLRRSPLNSPFMLPPVELTSSLFTDDASVSSSAASPDAVDLLQSDADMAEIDFLDLAAHKPVDEYGLPIPTDIPSQEDNDVEEVVRTDEWQVALPSLAVSTASTNSSTSDGKAFLSLPDIFRRPPVTESSLEILLCHFDRKTCGIMSIKDGPTENPWRTLIWPMVHESPALQHAVLSMTAFHMCRDRPSLRVDGVDHMRRSLRFLAQGLSHGNIKEDAALATTLVLAFSEAFDRHVSTGIEHLRGAKVLISQALPKLAAGNPRAVERFQFLYNVWLYLDVLARFTARVEDGSTDAQYPPVFIPHGQIDPLLGCAQSLFPIIGKAARIGQIARQASKNSVSIVSEAAKVKAELEQWSPDDMYMPLEDETNKIEDCTKTAEAYRLATLLHLHQAVPELSDTTSARDLAEQVLKLLASIPLSSRSCIVHIYPLLVAGCEALGDERTVVAERWEGMLQRMAIGNVDKAWQVTKEVWSRRDRFAQETGRATRSPASSRFGSPVSSFSQTEESGLLSWEMNSPSRASSPRLEKLNSYKKGELEYELSIRGSLHWMGVMGDWNWEVLLG